MWTKNKELIGRRKSEVEQKKITNGYIQFPNHKKAILLQVEINLGFDIKDRQLKCNSNYRVRFNLL
jgi:hypothetical protein